jgi:hypothetical protein
MFMPPSASVHRQENLARIFEEQRKVYRNYYPLQLEHRKRRNGCDLPQCDVGSVQEIQKGKVNSLEREVWKRVAKLFRQEKLIPKMIDRIKEILGVDDRGSNP